MDVLDQRVADLSSILEKLRSASAKDQDLSQSTNEASHGEWKVCFYLLISDSLTLKTELS